MFNVEERILDSEIEVGSRRPAIAYVQFSIPEVSRCVISGQFRNLFGKTGDP